MKRITLAAKHIQKAMDRNADWFTSAENITRWASVLGRNGTKPDPEAIRVLEGKPKVPLGVKNLTEVLGRIAKRENI